MEIARFEIVASMDMRDGGIDIPIHIKGGILNKSHRIVLQMFDRMLEDVLKTLALSVLKLAVEDAIANGVEVSAEVLKRIRELDYDAGLVYEVRTKKKE